MNMAEQTSDAPSTPKRKRTVQLVDVSPTKRPTLDTSSLALARPVDKIADMEDMRGSQSPGTAMRVRFKDLGLASLNAAHLDADQQESIAPNPVAEDTVMNDDYEESLRKRFKVRDASEQQHAAAPGAATLFNTEGSSSDQAYPFQQFKSASPTKSRVRTIATKAAARTKGPKTTSPRKPKRRSPPPPGASSASDLGSGSDDSVSPTNEKKDSDPYTWQDWEITGHLALDADDDGYGINGVGFRPTPQTAEARLQRRKKQIADWKSREAREQRQKRSERRYGASNVCDRSASPQRKQVSFVA